jgi:hypothetical protein
MFANSELTPRRLIQRGCTSNINYQRVTCSPSCKPCVHVLFSRLYINSASKAAVPYSMKSIKPAHGDRGSAKRRTAPRRTASNAESGNAPKRKRASQAKTAPASKKIACVSCGQADVPLMMGGRKFLCITHGAQLIYVRFLSTVHGCWKGKQ